LAIRASYFENQDNIETLSLGLLTLNVVHAKLVDLRSVPLHSLQHIDMTCKKVKILSQAEKAAKLNAAEAEARRLLRENSQRRVTRKGESVSLAAVARRFGVCARSLQHRLRGSKPRADEMASRQKLSPAEEKELAVSCERALDYYFPLTKAKLCELAIKVLRKREPDAAPLTSAWYRHFMARHPEMANRKARRMAKERAWCSSYPQLKDWYDEVCCRARCHLYLS
jgi:hypothetical protein